MITNQENQENQDKRSAYVLEYYIIATVTRLIVDVIHPVSRASIKDSCGLVYTSFSHVVPFRS